MDIKEQILVALGLNKDEAVKLGFQAKSEDGTIFVSTAEELEAGVDVSVLTEDGTTIPVPPGTYKLDTGVSFRVEDDGIVAELLESETEEEDTPKEEVEAKKEDEEKEDYEEEADVGDWKGMEKRIENLEIAVEKLKEDKVGSDDEEVEEMAEEVTEPGTNPKTITTKEVKEFSAEEEIEKLKAENEKLKTELAEQPAEAPINTNKFSSEREELSKVEINKLSKRERILYTLSNK
tara:strand:+ start:11201 stop:11905 length:705 start_codon:yes stop_codon:yes gene_type:complete